MSQGQDHPASEDSASEDSAAEERRLATRIRLDVVVAIARFFTQGSVLGYAISTDGSAGLWVLWAIVFVICATAATCAMVRAARLSRRYRFLKWGEE
ncbi:MAG: hypothetical protein ABWY54_04035 [Glaciihabitans sp.]